jgi:PKD repeat protein
MAGVYQVTLTVRGNQGGTDEMVRDLAVSVGAICAAPRDPG